MTSKQIMLILPVVCAALLCCCTAPAPVDRPVSPYAGRRVFAVAPMRNESGSLHADPLRTADRFAAEVARVRGLDTVPVNRVLATMQDLGLAGINTPQDAHRLRERLGVDGLVVGSITAYDPYDPPTLGLAVELYRGDRDAGGTGHHPDPRALSRAARLPGDPRDTADAPDFGPTSAIAGHYHAADPEVAALLDAYAVERGPDGTGEMTRRRFTASIDLYTEFVSYQLTARLMDAERLQLRSPQRRGPASTVEFRRHEAASPLP